MKVLSIVLLVGSTQAAAAEGSICRDASDCTEANSCCSAPA